MIQDGMYLGLDIVGMTSITESKFLFKDFFS